MTDQSWSRNVWIGLNVSRCVFKYFWQPRLSSAARTWSPVGWTEKTKKQKKTSCQTAWLFLIKFRVFAVFDGLPHGPESTRTSKGATRPTQRLYRCGVKHNKVTKGSECVSETAFCREGSILFARSCRQCPPCRRRGRWAQTPSQLPSPGAWLAPQGASCVAETQGMVTWTIFVLFFEQFWYSPFCNTNVQWYIVHTP